MKREELLKIAKPILFNTEMVQAILDNRKTVTRRAIKLDLGTADTDRNDNSYLYVSDEYGDWYHVKDLCRYQPGDILYARETWSIQSMSNIDKRIKFIYKAKGTKDLETRYVTDDRYEKLLKYESKNGWQPSLFMPREAARIFLKVTDVRVERLQDVTISDIEKEGYPYEVDFSNMPIAMQGIMFEWFVNLWNPTIKKQDLERYSLKANPYVWVIKFERVEI